MAATARLYTSGNSPFGARIAIAERAKNIEITKVPLPEGGLRAAEFLRLNPIAKIPVLVTEDDWVLPESSVILHWIEDSFPDPSLIPCVSRSGYRRLGSGAVASRPCLPDALYLFSPAERAGFREYGGLCAATHSSSGNSHRRDDWPPGGPDGRASHAANIFRSGKDAPDHWPRACSSDRNAVPQ